jgi:uncharacterized protein with PIN domain
MVIVAANNDSPYGADCIRCSDSLIAPDESRYITERHVNHLWACENCGQQFETSHHLDFNAPSEPLFC